MTGAPGESKCSTSCHTGSTGNQVVSITAVPPITEYAPGTTYTMEVRIQDAGSGRVRWGFQATALKADHTMAGTLQTGPGGYGPHELWGTNGGREYVSQTSNGATAALDPADGTYWGTTDGPVSWQFLWTAPPAGAGTVTLYAAMVSANGDQGPDGDNGYTDTLPLAEGAPVPVTPTTWGKIKQIFR